jgi:hypothetical protein
MKVKELVKSLKRANQEDEVFLVDMHLLEEESPTIEMYGIIEATTQVDDDGGTFVSIFFTSNEEV